MLITTANNRADPEPTVRFSSDTPTRSSALSEMTDLSRDISVKNFREYFHDALEQREELFSLFDLGYLGLEERASGEVLFQEICEKALRFAKQTNYVSDEFELLEKALRKKYVTNFSVFQSVPDSWTIRQLFPVLPIHRLNEYPTEYGILIDLTCDSDGKIDSFVDVKDIKEILELHPTTNGGPYFIGVCLLGAYQDVMGDFHNLFGSVNEAHVVVDESGRYHVQKLLAGSTVRQMAGIAGWSHEELLEAFRAKIRDSVASGRLTEDAGAEIVESYKTRSQDSTYLNLL
jgi:arginine decarboxylase